MKFPYELIEVYHQLISQSFWGSFVDIVICFASMRIRRTEPPCEMDSGVPSVVKRSEDRKQQIVEFFILGIWRFIVRQNNSLKTSVSRDLQHNL